MVQFDLSPLARDEVCLHGVVVNVSNSRPGGLLYSTLLGSTSPGDPVVQFDLSPLAA